MRKFLTISIASCIVASCAASDEAGANSSDDARLGEKVDRICFARGINGFQSRSDGPGLILTRGARDKFAVTFAGSCRAADRAQRIGISERFGGGCLTWGDAIYVSESAFSSNERDPFDPERCIVRSIHEWNEDAGTESASE